MEGWTVQKHLFLSLHFPPADIEITQENTFESLAPGAEKLYHCRCEAL